MDSLDESIVPPICDWLQEAKIYNHKNQEIPISQIIERVDAVILYFSMRDADRHNIIHEFSTIYDNTKHINLPLEVINIPMDDNIEDVSVSYENQAKWLTLMFDDPLIPVLQYRYGITSVPHLLVMGTDGTIISSHGILDLDVYGMNALLTWMPANNRNRLDKDLSVFDFSKIFM